MIQAKPHELSEDGTRPRRPTRRRARAEDGPSALDTRSPRCTAAEKTLRIEELIELCSRMASRKVLLEYAGRKWGLRRAQIDNLAAEARKEMRSRIAANRPHLFLDLLAALQSIASAALEERKYMAATMAFQSMAKLAGLDKQQVEITGALGGPHEILSVEAQADIVRRARRALHLAETIGQGDAGGGPVEPFMPIERQMELLRRMERAVGISESVLLPPETEPANGKPSQSGIGGSNGVGGPLRGPTPQEASAA